MNKHEKAIWAQNLLNDDTFKEVINDLKNTQISVIIGSNKHEIDEREQAYSFIKTIELIEGHLQGMAAENKIQDSKWRIL